MNILIRDAKIEDIKNGLLDVFIEGYRFHQNGRPDVFVNITDDELKEDLIKNFEKFNILVLLADENIVGYLAYNIKEKHTKKMNVDQLIIKKEFRYHGYGKMLMDKVREIGKENKCDRIELNCWMFNSNAIAMYEHIGFDRQRILYEMKL
ncbi:MAG: GNAT family N-acetyltransferase [Clostridia bacterium]